MIARASKLFLPTLRDDPADAEATNHKLLVRGGFVRQVTGGVWTFLPLGWRVHRKIEQIIREEMDAIGSQEMLMPVLTPFELWQKTGRDFIQEIFRLKDRKGADYVLPHDARGDGDVPRARVAELQAVAADALPHLDKEPGRAASARGADSLARVLDERRLLVRPQ